jgi:hypothetical protein
MLRYPFEINLYTHNEIDCTPIITVTMTAREAGESNEKAEMKNR